MINFGSTIRAHRRKSGLTQVALARRIGVEPTYLSAIENGRREPSLTLVREIGRAVSAPPEILFWESVSPSDGLSAGDRKAIELAKKVLQAYLRIK